MSTRGATSGFTLLEVLLALALSVVLLGGLYGALDLHWKYSTAGRAEVERSQLARALLQQMANDIRCAVFQPSDSASASGTENTSTNAASATSGGSGTGATGGTGTTGATGTTGSSSGTGTTSSSSGSTTVEVTDPTEAYFSSSVGVYGDASTLVLHISRPTRVTSVDQVPASDLQSVAYFLAGQAGGGFQELVAESATGGSGPATGLARLKGGRFEITSADQQGDVTTLASNTEVLAPEVSSLQFRYFDGVDWVDVWDSVEFGQLPNAIEIVLGFPSPPETTSTLTARSVSSLTDSYRLVVSLPLAEPYTMEQSQ